MNTEQYGQISLLFEVSWEVCNKVGGIYAVVSSKAMEATEQFGENYYLFGPDMGNNAEFEETSEPCWHRIRQIMLMKGMKCRFGRWNIPGRPKVVLVNFKDRYNQNDLLHEYWERYGVDSITGGWDYVEPVLFGTACGEVIATMYECLGGGVSGNAVAQFHEWMCGSGLLTVKKLAPGIGTIFTTHATMLGRSLAGAGVDIYNNLGQINPLEEAVFRGVAAKCSMERVSALEADCFTTVSQITAEEAGFLLNKEPDVVTPNGLEMRVIPDYSVTRDYPELQRSKLLNAINKLLRDDLPRDTRIYIISGRYEFHNKGIDVFLDALSTLNKALSKTDTHVLVLFAVMGGHHGLNPDAVSGDKRIRPPYAANWISSHYLYDEEHDPILVACRKLGLDNRPENKVKVIFVPALLDGADGFLNMTYEDVLVASDLGVFPSWYEPWGYTPHESAAYSVPTLTTDLSGFGIWTQSFYNTLGTVNGVAVVQRANSSYEDTVEEISGYLYSYSMADEETVAQQRYLVRSVANECSWGHFYIHYMQAYMKAVTAAYNRVGAPKRSKEKKLLPSTDVKASHQFIAQKALPESLSRLREYTKNLLWARYQASWELFSRLSPKIWEESRHNPVVTLENAKEERLNELMDDKSYIRMYKLLMEEFDDYMSTPINSYGNITPQTPIAYFSTEYGLVECLPVYSGGLGVLSGDHLKTASDLCIPLVAVGLLYKSGYFKQEIDKNKQQVTIYPENDFAGLPIEKVLDANGESLVIYVEMPGRILHANVWKVQVGRVKLYLMDTDIDSNTADDRRVTARLYEADRDFRLRQEILLGIGGVRLLDVLGYSPSVYHMNEGHSAFLIFERILKEMQTRRLSFEEASEFVRGSNIFTTHTPVDAGNERFAVDRMEPYFRPYAEKLGISWDDFLSMGRLDDGDYNSFEMTVLALKYSYKSNAVSWLHGVIARRMWQSCWKDLSTYDVPIGYVTNGIHIPSYINLAMKLLLDKAMGGNWENEEPFSPAWEKVREIPDSQFMNALLACKFGLVEGLKSHLPHVYKKFSIPYSAQKEIIANLESDTLVIGFARRFAPYKRATLIFRDPERLAKILNDPDKPVILVFAGKSHPADGQGGDILSSVVNYCLDPRFMGKIFFIEDYDLATSRALVQGCDVWLNTPRRPYEACGTSGQKVPVNGGINLSISDGWWCEGYNGKNGWNIGPVTDLNNIDDEQSDEDDAISLYNLLEDQIIPLYYDRGDDKIPHKWISIAKESMISCTSQFSSARMLKDYLSEYYIPAAERHAELACNEFGITKSLSAWKKTVKERFDSVNIADVTVNGLDKNEYLTSDVLEIMVTLEPGQMSADELEVELVVGRNIEKEAISMPFECVKTTKNKATYKCIYRPTDGGRYSYAIRILPVTKGLGCKFDTRLWRWI